MQGGLAGAGRMHLGHPQLDTEGPPRGNPLLAHMRDTTCTGAPLTERPEPPNASSLDRRAPRVVPGVCVDRVQGFLGGRGPEVPGEVGRRGRGAPYEIGFPWISGDPMRTDTHPASHGYSEDRVPSLDVAPAALQGEETGHQLGRGPEPGGAETPPGAPKPGR